MPGKVLRAPWATPKCKPIFCKSQEVLKRHIFLSGNTWLWQGQDSFLLYCHHFTPQLEGTLPEELSEMAVTILWQEICTTDQQLTWWKPIFPSKMVFPEWLTRQLKWLQKKKKGYRSNYLKSCLILVYFTNDNKLSHFSSALLQLFIRISIKSFLLFLIPFYFHFLFRDFRLQLWTLAPLCCFSSCTSRLGADWNKVTSPLPAPEQSPGQGATPWINTLWVTLLLRLGES